MSYKLELYCCIKTKVVVTL